MERPIVGLWGDPDALSIALVEKLLANFCSILIFSKKENTWREKTSHIRDTRHFLIETGEKELRTIDYALIVSVSEKPEIETRFRQAVAISEEHRAKTLLVLNYSQPARIEKNFPLPGNLGVVYVGDLFGPRMDLNNKSAVARMIKDTLARRPVAVSRDEFIFPTPIFLVAETLVKWLFSFGPYGEEVAILPRGISTADFYKYVARTVSNTNFILKEYGGPTFQRNVAKYVLNFDIFTHLRQTFEWFIKHRPQELSKLKDDRELRTKRSGLPFFFLLVVALLLSSPPLILAGSFIPLGVGVAAVTSGRLETSKNFLSTAGVMAEISHRESLVFSSLPVFGLIYQPITFFSEISARVSKGAEEAISILESSKELSSKILGDEVYNPLAYSERIGLGLDNVYRELSFLEGELAEGGSLEAKIVYHFIQPGQLRKIKNAILASKTFVSRLPDVLGTEKKKTYLVLLQNNMELRPTGGFIGSFALLTFEGGRLSGASVSDVYSADGQLKGHVEPPAPIKKYLGEAGWYLRDSNWDPDFPTTAGKVEWFLDKEIDTSVDGVVSIDLEVAKLLLKEVGPITVPDFGTTVDYKNLYEKTQEEVETGFFPGSYKKATFLAALTKGLLETVSGTDRKDSLGILKALSLGLNSRHIQIFLHDPVLQKEIGNLGWDGAVSFPDCSGNCLSDWLGIVEANVGVNKANYFVKRDAALEVFLKGGVVKKQLSISFQNNANPALGRPATYKVYLRLIGPAASSFGNVLVQDASVPPDVNQVHGREEAGVYFEVPPGQKRRIVFLWTSINNLRFREKGEYQLYWRKQAGTGNDNISVTLHLPGETLTKGGNFSYNTTLAKDFMAKIFWYTPTPMGATQKRGEITQ